jgi:hypothetical protein
MPRFFIVILFSTALIAQSAKFIQGSIIDTENNPVAGAQIVVLPDSTMSFSTSTGSFRFVAPATMALHLRITHTAYLPLDTILSPPFAQRNILPLRERVYRLSGVSTTALRAEQALTPVPFRDFNRRELKSDLDVRDVPMLLSAIGQCLRLQRDRNRRRLQPSQYPRLHSATYERDDQWYSPE